MLDKHYKIAFVPPGGILLKQDLTLQKMALYFKKSTNINVDLIYIKDESPFENENIFSLYILCSDEKEMIQYIKNQTYDLIIHRAWMHRYSFASKLAKEFENIVFYIKDWIDDMPREKYQFLFDTDEDYDAIKTIFESNRKILSHYGKSYTNKWAKKYNINRNNFIHFPEYCLEENFIKRDTIEYKKRIKLLYAGVVVNTNRPNELSEARYIFDIMKKITTQKIEINFVTLPRYYDIMFDKQNKNLWSDYLYEHYFNHYFSIKRGGVLDSTLFNGYHFGIPGGLYYNNRDVTCINACNAITSKISLYLEAGIPLLVNKKWKELAKLVIENDIGILINNGDLDNINKKLKISQKRYMQLVENVYKFREKFTYNNKTMKPILEMLA